MVHRLRMRLAGTTATARIKVIRILAVMNMRRFMKATIDTQGTARSIVSL